MSMVEIVVVLAILGFVGLGSTTMIRNMMSQQVRSNVKMDLHRLRDRFVAVLKNDQAWGNTIVNAANAGKLNCIGNSNPINWCTQGPQAGNGNFRIFDASGNPFFIADEATRGFTVNGENCNTFNAAGNDACPFRYDIQWSASCPPTENQCPDPEVTITGTLQVAPTDKSDIRTRVTASDYNFVLTRRVQFRFEVFEAHWAHATSNGGACGGAGYRQLPFNREGHDPGNIARITIGSNIEFTDPNGGLYLCKVSLRMSNMTGGAQVRVRQVGGAAFPTQNVTSGRNLTLVGASGSYTPSWTPAVGTEPETTMSGSFEVNVTGPTTLQLEADCNPHLVNGRDLGEAFGGTIAGDNIYRTISCMKTR